VNLLLDTHGVIWWALNSRALRAEARQAISSADRVLVSAASAWEIAIKTALGRVHLKDPLSTIVRRSGFEPLPVTFEHAERLSALPAHHADPFDRLLLVQALVEGLTLVSHDRVLQAYAVPIIWT
jgi:PIN domain nuclease of toxin-antitoxin system